MAELYHYNHNHDPRTGKFTFSKSVLNAKKKASNYDKRRQLIRTNRDVNEIVKTFSNYEMWQFGLSPSPTYDASKDKAPYVSKYDVRNIVNRSLVRYGKIPVSFFEIVKEDDGHNHNTEFYMVIGTRNDPKYRKKGYASEAAQQAMDYINKHPEQFEGKELYWEVEKHNKGSIALAEKNGFTYVGPHNNGIDLEYKKVLH